MKWLTIHNHLSQCAETEETLTPSQVSARDAIRDAIRRQEGHMNLWGSPGVGKTFLAHYLHHRADLLYFPSPERYDRKVAPGSTVVIDNAPHHRQAARSLYDKIRWSGKDYSAVANVMLITRKPIEDAVHRMALAFTEEDVTHMEVLMQQRFGVCDSGQVTPYAQHRSGLWLQVKALAQIGGLR